MDQEIIIDSLVLKFLGNDILFRIIIFLPLEKILSFTRINRYMNNALRNYTSMGLELIDISKISTRDLVEMCNNQTIPACISTTHTLVPCSVRYNSNVQICHKFGIYGHIINFFLRHAPFMKTLILHNNEKLSNLVVLIKSVCMSLEKIIIMWYPGENDYNKMKEMLDQFDIKVVIVCSTYKTLKYSPILAILDNGADRVEKKFLIIDQSVMAFRSSDSLEIGTPVRKINFRHLKYLSKEIKSDVLYSNYVTRKFGGKKFMTNKKNHLKHLLVALNKASHCSIDYNRWSVIARSKKHQNLFDTIVKLIMGRNGLDVGCMVNGAIFDSNTFHRLFHTSNTDSLFSKTYLSNLEYAKNSGIAFWHIEYIDNNSCIRSVKWLLDNNYQQSFPGVNNIMGGLFDQTIRCAEREGIRRLLIEKHIEEHEVLALTKWISDNANEFFANRVHSRRSEVFAMHPLLWKQSLQVNTKEWHNVFSCLLKFGWFDWIDLFFKLNEEATTEYIKDNFCLASAKHNNKLGNEEFITKCVTLVIMGIVPMSHFLETATKLHIDYYHVLASEQQTMLFLKSIPEKKKATASKA